MRVIWCFSVYTSIIHSYKMLTEIKKTLLVPTSLHNLAVGHRLFLQASLAQNRLNLLICSLSTEFLDAKVHTEKCSQTNCCGNSEVISRLTLCCFSVQLFTVVSPINKLRIKRQFLSKRMFAGNVCVAW